MMQHKVLCLLGGGLWCKPKDFQFMCVCGGGVCLFSSFILFRTR